MATGLILVDIQNDYFPGGSMELTGMEAAAENAARLLGTFRDNRWPTFHVQHIAIRKGAAFFLPDTHGARIYPGIEPLSGETVVQKHFPNSFRETRLQQALASEGIDHVVICGAMSHMCIDATTRAAADLGYPCTVVHDACATKDLEFAGKLIESESVHAAFMAALGSSYAEVTGCADYLAGIR